jgi:hypothetical protein
MKNDYVGDLGKRLLEKFQRFPLTSGLKKDKPVMFPPG